MKINNVFLQHINLYPSYLIRSTDLGYSNIVQSDKSSNILCPVGNFDLTKKDLWIVVTITNEKFSVKMVCYLVAQGVQIYYYSENFVNSSSFYNAKYVKYTLKESLGINTYFTPFEYTNTTSLKFEYFPQTFINFSIKAVSI